MPNSLFNKFLGAESNPSHNPFDLSHRDVYSMKVGQLLPVSSALVLGDGTYKIDMQQVLRSDSLLSAAFTKMDAHYEWFFVPVNHLYHSFNQIVAQREDLQTSLPSTMEFPYFKFKYFLVTLLPYAIIDQLLDMCEFHPGFQTDNLPDTWTFKDGSGTTRTLKWSEDYVSKYYSMSSMFPNESVSLNIIRNLDFYGYGNYLPFIKTFVSAFINDYAGIKYNNVNLPLLIPDLHEVIHVMFDDIYDGGSISEFFAFSHHEFAELFDGIVDGLHLTRVEEINLNLWKPLAYNKIYGQVYRNPYYDFNWLIENSITEEEYEFPYVKLFNLDDIQGEINYYGRLFCIFDTKYHQYHKDMFTGVLPNSQFGDVSVMIDDRSWLKLSLASSNNGLNAGDAKFQSLGSSNFTPVLNSSGVDSGNPVYARFNPGLAISVLTQRKAEALQRFSENMLRAGNRTRDAFKAHFGYAPLSESKNDAMYLGSFDGDIELNTVAATDTNEFTQQGDLASYGVGLLRGQEITLKTNDFGILICIGYISKPAEYDNFGISRQNMMLDVFDYPYSEFQNVGLEPIDARHLSYSLQGDSFNRSYDEKTGLPYFNVGILGYLPPFIEFKTDFDKIHGEYYTSVPTANELDVFDLNISQGDFSHFVTPRDDLNFTDYKSWLYVNPNSVDNVFSEKANGSQSTDQFKCNCMFKIYGSLPLSVIGLPY